MSPVDSSSHNAKATTVAILKRTQRRYFFIGGKRRDQRGAALVEAAIIFIPLCIIVFGIIEYGFVFKDSLTLSSATRAGARAASAMPGPPQTAFMDYVSAATGKAASAANFKAGDQMWIYLAQDDGTPANG